MDLIKALNEQQLKEVPQVEVGDTVRVHVKVKEGARERIQVFEGIVIAKKHGGIEETITVRRMSYGVGVEKVSLSTPRLSTRSRLCVTAMFAARSCITCVTASVRLPSCARSCKRFSRSEKRHDRLVMPFFLVEGTGNMPFYAYCFSL